MGATWPNWKARCRVTSEISDVERRAIDIVVVDSDPLDAGRIQHALSSLINEVEVLLDRESATERFLSDRADEAAVGQSPPDLLILDVGVMGGGTWSMIERLRERERFTDTAIVVVAGSPSADMVMQAEKAGADYFQVKPVSLVRLAELVASQQHLDLAVVRRTLAEDLS